jgi:hypothetical protein
MLLLVMYEPKSSTALAPLHEAVGALGPCCHFFNSFCLVSTENSPLDAQRILHQLVDGQVSFYVSQFTHEHADYVPRHVLDWIAANQDSDHTGSASCA